MRKVITHGGLFVREDVGKGNAGGVVDASMDKLSADATGIALTRSVTGDMAAKALDVDMNQTFRLAVFIEDERRRVRYSARSTGFLA